MITPLRRARRSAGLGLGLALAVTLFVNFAALTVPIYDMQLYDRVLLSRNMDTVAMLSITACVGLVIYGALDYLRSAALVTIADGVGRALSIPVLSAAVRRGMHGDLSAGAEAMRDLNEVRSFLSSGAVSNPLDALCAPVLLAVMFMLHPAFGWLGVLGISVLVMIGIVTDVLVRPALTKAAAQRAQAGHQLASGLRDAELTEGLGMFAAMARRWAWRHGTALEEARGAGEVAQRVAAIAKVVRLALLAGVMVVGATLILSHEASAGSLMGANLLLGKVLGPFDALVSSWRRWIETGTAWQRVTKVLGGVGEPVPVAGAASGQEEAGLVLQDVGYRLPNTGRVILDGIDLVLPPGTGMALIGPNGAGKSTLLRLLVGLLTPAEGSVRLDGVEVTEADRSRFGYLPQGVHLLDGTVAENVARFTAAPAEETIDAASAAGVHDFIGRLRQGYDTPVSHASASLSGGQRQRIGLARALFGTPRLMVLDEPDASLDQAGEDALLRAIDAARAAGAVVVVATHRPKLLAKMDCTLALANGRAEPLRVRQESDGHPVAVGAAQAQPSVA